MHYFIVSNKIPSMKRRDDPYFNHKSFFHTHSPFLYIRDRINMKKDLLCIFILSYTLLEPCRISCTGVQVYRYIHSCTYMLGVGHLVQNHTPHSTPLDTPHSTHHTPIFTIDNLKPVPRGKSKALIVYPLYTYTTHRFPLYTHIYTT